MQHLGSTHRRQEVVLDEVRRRVAQTQDHVGRCSQSEMRLAPAGHDFLERERLTGEEHAVRGDSLRVVLAER